MSLNNLRLPEMLIAELYKNHLLPMDNAAVVSMNSEVAPPLTRPTLKYLGKGLKKIAIFVHFPDDIHLPDDLLNFLANVLKACNLTLGDIAIVNIAQQQVSVEMVKTALAPVNMLFFNLDPMAIGIDLTIPIFSIKKFNEISLLKAPALEKLHQNNEEGKLLKSKLWLCLKELFTV